MNAGRKMGIKNEEFLQRCKSCGVDCQLVA